MSTLAAQTRKKPQAISSDTGRTPTQWVPFVVLIGLVLLAYWPALKNGFIWDDDLMLTDNPLMKAADGLKWIWFSTRPTDYLPMTYSDFWLEWRLWGMKAGGYHFTNVLLHALNAVLLWRFVARFILPPSNQKSGWSLAWFAAALYAVHPVNVATVAWIAERKNTLAMAFTLLSVTFYFAAIEQKENRKRAYILSLAFFVFSLLSKTAGVALPAVFLCFEWWKNGVTKRGILRTLPFFAIALVMGLVTIWFQNHRAISSDFPDRPMLLRLAGAGMAAWFYLGKAVLPIALSPVYPQWAIHPREWTAYVPLALLVAAVAVLWGQRARIGRGPVAALTAFLLMLAPVIGFLNVNYFKFSLVADHWQYFSLAIAMPAIVWAAGRLLAEEKVRTAALAVVTVVFAMVTFKEAQLYDNSRIWRATLAKDPNSYVAANNLAQELADHGELDEALKNFQRALALHPHYRNALTGMATTYLQMHNYAAAIPPLQELAAARPNDFYLRFNLGSVYLSAGQAQAAIDELEAALRITPEDMPEKTEWKFAADLATAQAEAGRRLGDAYLAIGRQGDALKAYQTALRLNPDSTGAHYRLATLLGRMRDRDGARRELGEALKIEPGFIDALNDLAWSYATDSHATAQQRNQAKQMALKAADMTKFKEPGVLDTLSAACATTGDFDGAVKYAQQAQSLAAERGQKDLSADIQRRLDLYNRKQAYTE